MTPFSTRRQPHVFIFLNLACADFSREAEVAKKFHVCSRTCVCVWVCVCGGGRQMSWSTVNSPPCTERRAKCGRLLLGFEVLSPSLGGSKGLLFFLSFRNSYKVLIQCPPHDVFLLVPQCPSHQLRILGVPTLSSSGFLHLPFLLLLMVSFWNPLEVVNLSLWYWLFEVLCSLLFR